MDPTKMTGLALLQAAMAGKIPPASIAETVPMKPAAVEEGYIRIVARAELGAVSGKDAMTLPDMYLYTFTLDDRDPVRVPEHRLTSTQAELARRVLQTGPAEM